MDWKKYLTDAGYTAEEISNMEKTFGAEKMAKAFEAPIRAATEAKAQAEKANQDLADFQNKYQTEIMPEISKAFKDAIDTRTKNAALEARLKAATEYGFLQEDPTAPAKPAVPGVKANANEVPGSPEIDPRYVKADDFSKAVDSIPEMLGRLTKMSNEHFHLFGKPLLNVDELINKSKESKGRKSVYDIWNDEYKVEDKRKELAAAAQAEHDRKVSEDAIRKYTTEHGIPFTRPAQPSMATRFTPSNATDVRQPWKGSKERQGERHNKMIDALAGKAASVAVQ